MRVVIDARPAVGQPRTGVGQYTWHLVRLLPFVDPETTYVAWYLDPRALRRSRRFEDVPNLLEHPTRFPSRLFQGLSARLGVPRVEWFVPFDVLFAPNFLPPATARRPFVVTVHDLAFRVLPDAASSATRRWLDRLDQTLARAGAIISVSHSTRRDLLGLSRVAAERVTVIPLGVDHQVFRPLPSDAARAVCGRLGITPPYLLWLGGIERRKNLPMLLRAFAALPDTVRPTLVLAGPQVPWSPEGWADLRASLHELPPQIRHKVVVTGYVSDEDKVALLGGAAGFIYPSLYEGFGLPVLEAMACGTPVLTSNVSALPETAADAALLVDPRDQGAIAHGIEKILTDGELQRRLRGAGLARAALFQWEETARRTAEVLRRVSA
jgi:glycosyltransferase involved in cell wall biosynthesis